ncbi:HPr family phosphocarrier protein [Paenibacillus hexagrammi]|uniref:HPr family phosphocarrier protein n=1 Tax=Paenibacillus hexagrammi TaxID=2908839 RepID=A0ABY3SQ66_9BACL|nr:HPr family phosphocarrier protein [Paenibacillus sp. YPD9-1]UJF35824.1 HPr family phosphocarrier protein [Paenibacillus sp. YPD9-1]
MRVHEFTIRSHMERKDLTEISAKSSHFMSEITLVYTEGHTEHIVDMKSVLGMLLVPIKEGTTIRLITKGKDEEEALHYIYDWFESR